MRTLWLGPVSEEAKRYLDSKNDEVFFTQDPVGPDSVVLQKSDFIVSFGYRHILPLGVLQCYLKRAINIHISYLPWNRGADPNLWSFLEDTPKGVSIHYLTEKIDAGDILCQEEIVNCN